MHREAKYNPGTQQATFWHNSHYGETLPKTVVDNNAPKALHQNLASDDATSTPDRLIRDYRQNKIRRNTPRYSRY